MSNTSNNTPPEALLPNGTTLAHGKYRIEGHLGSGGFGNTYVAIDTAFNERVAIKELYIKDKCGRAAGSTEVSITLTENQRTFEQLRNKFRKEAMRLRKLQNPHIVQVHDLFDDNGTSYYVMDYIEGESLSARLKRTGKPVSEDEVMQVILPQLCDALLCVHDKGIFHLDIKPGNILHYTEGNLGYIVLIDFGASKQMHTDDGATQSTSTSLACTPGYAPTEQMEGNFDKFGPWTDLYSLGATLYHLLTLKQPPLPSSIAEDPDGALQFPAGISKSMVDLVKWLMQPVRTKRPQSVVEVVNYMFDAREKRKAQSRQKTQQQNQSREARKNEEKERVNPAPDDEDDDTIAVKRKKRNQPKPEPTPTPKPTPTPVPEPTPSPEPDEPDRKGGGCIYTLFRAGCLVTILFLVIFSIFVYRSCSTSSASDDPADSSEVVVPKKQVTDLEVHVYEGPKNMRNYKFTGEIADTFGALPNGFGTAKFPASDGVEAAVYNGAFENGLCQCTTDATLTFESGDKYEGGFDHGYYTTGKYTMKDGSYFTGSFEKGSPYEGFWYNADGSISARVVKGKEQ